jgi:hypothetical protein
MLQICTCIYAKRTVFLSDLNQTLIFSTYFLKEFRYQKIKISPVLAQAVPYGPSYGRTAKKKLTVTFHVLFKASTIHKSEQHCLLHGISSPAESGVTRPFWSRITCSFTSRHCVTGSSLPSKIGTTGFSSRVHCNAKSISSKHIMHAFSGSLSNSLSARNILFLQGQKRFFLHVLITHVWPTPWFSPEI